MHNSIKQELQYSIKLWFFEDRIILCCCSNIKFSVDKLIKLFDGKFESGHIL